jgi:hypothetical protein
VRALCNIAAVWPLARQGGHGYLRELSRNPLILATLAGLAGNLMGLQLPALVSTTLSRVGAAALPLGLMAVGAGLQMGALREAPRLAAGFMAIKHLAMPLVALVLVTTLQLPAAQQAVIVAFAAMPTASSAYVLAGAHGRTLAQSPPPGCAPAPSDCGASPAAADRAAFGAAQELGLVPGPQLQQRGAGQPLAHVEVGQRRCAGRTCSRGRPAGSRRSRRCGCPWRAQLARDGAVVLDRQVADAAPRVQPVGRHDGLRRAGVDAGAALPHAR